MRYQCHECDRQFEEPDIVTETHGMTDGSCEKHGVCPYCKGYFEIRCKVNAGSGYWSAFWLQADSPYTASVSKGGVGGAEIDIFERIPVVSYINYKFSPAKMQGAFVDC